MNAISVVIPNWNGEKTLETALKSVFDTFRTLNRPYEVIVVDDFSTDSSVEIVERFTGVRIFKNFSNRGFSLTANFGVRCAKYDLVFIMSNDIIIEPSFEHLVIHFLDDKVFAVSPQVRWKNSGKFAYGKRTANWENGYFKVVESKYISYPSYTLFACGGSALFDRKKFLDLGGFDELYHPFYWEEIDISYRALKRGLKIIHEPSAVVFNSDDGVIKNSYKSRYVKHISGRNSYLFLWKNITSKTMIKNHLKNLFPSLLKDILDRKFRFAKCFFSALVRLPKALYKRLEEKKNTSVSDEEIIKVVNQDISLYPCGFEIKQEKKVSGVDNEGCGNYSSANGVSAAAR
ncbi:glycosyltransferase [bacterium]|nr:glycosyltransferase [bacterium]